MFQCRIMKQKLVLTLLTYDLSNLALSINFKLATKMNDMLFSPKSFHMGLVVVLQTLSKGMDDFLYFIQM